MDHVQTGRNQYNIVTSSDNTLIPQMAVSLTAMAKNLQNDFVDFYFLHSQVSPENISFMRSEFPIRRIMRFLFTQADGTGRLIIRFVFTSCFQTVLTAFYIWMREIRWS